MLDIFPKREPPPISREDLLEGVSFDDVDRKATEVPDDKLDTFESLVEYLTKDIDEPLLKLRALFIWLGNQNILKTDYGNVESDTPKGMLQAIKEDFDYNHILDKLCRFADIPCSLIEGRQRLLPDDGDKLANQPSAWCAVFVKGWRFVVPNRCFLGLFGDNTGKNWQKVEQDGLRTQENDPVLSEYRHIFEEYFFLMDPSSMIYFYRPNNDKWQLLKTPISEALFMSQPCVFPSFFESGLQLRKGQLAEVKAQHGHANIVLRTTEEDWSDRLLYTLYFRTGQEKEFPATISADKYVILSNPDLKGEISIEVRFPVEGIYRLNFQLQSKFHRTFLKFILKCEDAKFKFKPLPLTPEIGWGPGKEAKQIGIKDISHTDGIIHTKASEDLNIEFKVNPGTTISTRYLTTTKPANDQEMKKRVKTRVRNGDVHIWVNLIDGEGVIEISAKKKGSNEPTQNVINYLVSTEETPKRLKLKETPREKEDKATLKKSLKDGKLADIKDALASYRRHDVEEEEIVTEATEIIHFLQVKQDLWDAMLRRHKGILEQAIAAAEALESPNRIMSLLTRAKEILKRLEQQDQVKVLVMKQTTISELHKYNHPKQVVHDVMMATYSLLGEKIAYLDDWEMIQSLTRKTGRCGLLRKIREFDFSKTNKAAYSFAKEKIDKYEERVVRLASGGAGTFYKWCKFTLNQIAVSREDLHNDFTYDEESEISK